MDLESITVSDFKAQFVRDFAYLPVYSNTKLYNAGAEVYYSDTELFYKCTENGTVGQGPDEPYSPWEVYSDDLENYVLDSDIERAFLEAKICFNQALWGTEDQIKLGFLYLTAYFLVQDLRASLGGLYGNGYFPVSSKSAGNVSESYAIPAGVSEDPLLSMYTANPYGQKYLTMIYPLLRGNFGIAFGRTTP